MRAIDHSLEPNGDFDRMMSLLSAADEALVEATLQRRDREWCEALVGIDSTYIEIVTERFNGRRLDPAALLAELGRDTEKPLVFVDLLCAAPAVRDQRDPETDLLLADVLSFAVEHQPAVFWEQAVADASSALRYYIGETRRWWQAAHDASLDAVRLEAEIATLRKEDPIIAAVVAERVRQDTKWGEQNHDAGVWSLILAEEVGEAAHDALHGLASLRKELIEVAAVAVAWIGAIDRAARSDAGKEEGP